MGQEHESNDLEKQKAAELLLADAIRERDEAQGRVDWLQACVERYKGSKPARKMLYDLSLFSRNGDAGHSQGETRVTSSVGGDEAQYGAIKSTVYNLMLGAHKKLKMTEVTSRFVALGMVTDAKSPHESVRNAMKALMKEGKVKKSGALHYRAVEPKEGLPVAAGTASGSQV